MTEPRSLPALVAAAAEEVKAQDMTVLDLSGISTVTDYFLICTGRSLVHVQAIAEHIQDKLKEEGYNLLRREGFREAKWILLDYGSLVAHIFQAQERDFFALERLWGDARAVEL